METFSSDIGKQYSSTARRTTWDYSVCVEQFQRKKEKKKKKKKKKRKIIPDAPLNDSILIQMILMDKSI